MKIYDKPPHDKPIVIPVIIEDERYDMIKKPHPMCMECCFNCSEERDLPFCMAPIDIQLFCALADVIFRKHQPDDTPQQ